MKAINILAVSALLGSALLALPAVADEGMPEVKTSDGISYVSGGVGEDERSAMQQHAKDYNLHLLFAIKSGAYLADVKVTILNAKGHAVLDAVSNGPWFYAKLAPGKYTVKADMEGKVQTRTITVGKGKSAKADMVWQGHAERAGDDQMES